MAAVAAAVAVAAAADFVAEVLHGKFQGISSSGGTPIPFRLPCKVRHFLRRAVAAAADDESMPQSRRGLLAVASPPQLRMAMGVAICILPFLPFQNNAQYNAVHGLTLPCII